MSAVLTAAHKAARKHRWWLKLRADPARHTRALTTKRRWTQAHKNDPAVLAATRAARTKWRQANRNKLRVASLQRRAAGSITSDELTEIEVRTDGRCLICKKLVRFSDRSFDHIIPISKGGRSDLSNLALAHMRCNSSRGAGRTPGQLWLL